MKEWYALHTSPYSERAVAGRLEQHEIETYIPEISSSSDRPDAGPVPFFPGYMFISLDMSRANPRYWRTTPGVRYIVGYGDEPAVVDEQLIRVIREQLDALDARQRQPQGRFVPGDRVRITTGPFQDMIAIFDGPVEPADRVHILLEMMARSRRVRIAASNLEKVDPGEQKPQAKRPRRSRGRGRPIRS